MAQGPTTLLSLALLTQTVSVSQIQVLRPAEEPPPERYETAAQQTAAAILAQMAGRGDMLETPATGNSALAPRPPGPTDQTVSVARLLHQIPKSARLAYDRAGKLSRGGQIEDAIKELEKAIKLDPEFAEAHNNLGVLYAQLTRYREAETELRRKIELMPGSPNGHFNLALVLVQLGNREEAERRLRRAIQLGSSDRATQLLLDRLLADDRGAQ